MNEELIDEINDRIDRSIEELEAIRGRALEAENDKSELNGIVSELNEFETL